MMNEERLILNDINTDGNKLDSKNEVFGSGLSTDDVTKGRPKDDDGLT